VQQTLLVSTARYSIAVPSSSTEAFDSFEHLVFMHLVVLDVKIDDGTMSWAETERNGEREWL